MRRISSAFQIYPEKQRMHSSFQNGECSQYNIFLIRILYESTICRKKASNWFELCNLHLKGYFPKQMTFTSRGVFDGVGKQTDCTLSVPSLSHFLSCRSLSLSSLLLSPLSLLLPIPLRLLSLSLSRVLCSLNPFCSFGTSHFD